MNRDWEKMNQTPPVIGACMPVEEISNFRDWLFDKDRDLELQSFTQSSVLDGDWRPLAQEAVRLLDGHKGRLGIHGPFWGLTLSSPDPEIQRVVSHRMMQGLEVCSALGATQMVVHSPFSHWTRNNFPRFHAWRQGVHDAIEATLKDAIQRAESEGITIVLENIEDCDPAARVDFAKEVGSPALQISLDTGHAECARGMTGSPPVDYYVREAGSMLRHVHLQDCDGYADRHWALGEGTIHWNSVFRALSEIDADPHLVLELRDYATIPKAMAYLEREGLGQ